MHIIEEVAMINLLQVINSNLMTCLEGIEEFLALELTIAVHQKSTWSR